MIVAPQNVHWVLDRIAHEVGDRLAGEVVYTNFPLAVPEASNYFVTHYTLVPKLLRQVNPAHARIVCLFTHESTPVANYLDALNLCHAIICENNAEFDRLLRYGVRPELLHMVVEGGDPARFQPHQRTGTGSILVSSACYARKNPPLFFEVTRLLPERKFVLVGKDWDPNELPLNVEYHDRVDYARYPELYAGCDVFLSCSTLEGGGPASLIEAMHANIMPVVSDTGNAREYIVPGYNGFIFPVDASAERVAQLVERAYTLNPKFVPPYSDVSDTVAHLTWENYARQVAQVFKEVALDPVL